MNTLSIETKLIKKSYKSTYLKARKDINGLYDTEILPPYGKVKLSYDGTHLLVSNR